MTRDMARTHRELRASVAEAVAATPPHARSALSKNRMFVSMCAALEAFDDVERAEQAAHAALEQLEQLVGPDEGETESKEKPDA